MKFGLMFFAASEDSLDAHKYRLVLESARYADRAGFTSIWLPERHFTRFGGLYPNPAVLHAALATCTSTIRLNAGSVVAPLHHPVRIAEEWSVVDNLSHGRVGISFASGWNPNDFLFFPERYATRDDHVVASMRAVQALWRGEAFAGTNGTGEPCALRIFPRPVQSELPVWMTVAGNPKNFARAGASGANLLTHLLDQDEAVLATRVAMYRRAREEAGFDPATGEVSLMVHTLVGADADAVREQARGPYCSYIKANIGLFKGLAKSRGRDADLSSMAPADLDEFVNFLYDRFAASRGLIGTPESCAALVSRLERAGVTELACLLDFGPDTDLILSCLPHLARLKDAARASVPAVLARPAAPAAAFDRDAVRRRCTHEISGDAFHARLERRGIRADAAFRPAATIWRRDGEALAHLTLDAATNGYRVHPASLDACCRMLAAALPDLEAGDDSLFLPSGFSSCDVRAPLSGSVWVHTVVTSRPDERSHTFSGSVRVYGEDGRPLAAIDGIRLTPIDCPQPADDTSALLYERVWQPLPATPAPATRVDGRWAVIANGDAIAPELSRLFVNNGAEYVADAGDPSVRGIVFLGGADPFTASSGFSRTLLDDSLRGLLDVAQSSGATPIWIVTRGLGHAPLWGFGRALAVERPGALGGLIELDPATPVEQAAQQIMDIVAGRRDEDMIAFRDDGRLVPRLRRMEFRRSTHAPIAFDANDTILITGGTGGLGLLVAGWTAARGARHLILCGRRAPGPDATARIDALRAAGADVVIAQVDVADEDAFAKELAAASGGRPITSVFHLAGALDDGRIETQTWERFSAVLRSKVQGAWNLHRLTLTQPLKHFVLFSSVASLMPAPGQSNYAATNAFLDALAEYRRARQLPALAVSWGPWSGAGHADTAYGTQAHDQLAAMGIGSMVPELGLRVLDRLMREDRGHAVAVPVDWALLLRADPAAARLRLLADLASPDEAGARADRSRGPSALVDALRALPADEREPHLLGFLSDLVITALKLRRSEPLDPRQRLFDIGLDSIVALELKGDLERALGAPLSATLLFVHPTLDALATYILAEIVGDTSSEEDLTLALLREIDVSRGA